MGTGDTHPIVSQQSLSYAASSYEAPRYVGSTRHKGLRSYAMAGQQRSFSSDDPSLTGGGGIGYNASLYNY
jgi:hypothetical protein